MHLARLTGAIVPLLILTANAGEIIGNTFISEKHGYIEILSPAGKWSFKDRESEGNMIVTLTVKDAINGTHPTMSFWGFPNAGDAIAPDFFLKLMRENLTQQGVEIGPIETLRLGGKQAYRFKTSMTRGGQIVLGVTSLLPSKGVIFSVQCVANKVAFEALQPMCAEVLENAKY